MRSSTDPTEAPSDLVLTEEESDDLNFASPKPAEVSYSGQDFDIEGLVRRMDRGDIVIPSFGNTEDDIETAGFQRGFVWRRPQMDRFIESLLLGFPIPGIFLVRQGDGRLLVLDGQQRLRTLQHFYNGSHMGRSFSLHAVADRFQGLTYDSLQPEQRRTIDNSFIQATIVTAQPDADDMGAIYQIFERLNSGGTQLTAHEIRVALYAGPVIEFLESLNRNTTWRNIYGGKNARIRDQELIARILALYLDHENYRRPLKSFINKLLEANRKNVSDELLKAGALFEEAANLLHQADGREALRWASRQVNNAWSDAIFFGLMKGLSRRGEINPEDIRSTLEKLREDPHFKGFVTGPSADEEKVARRLAMAQKAFEAL